MGAPSGPTHSGRGLAAAATVRITHNDIFFNTAYTWEISGGVIETHEDNRTSGTGVGTLSKISY